MTTATVSRSPVGGLLAVGAAWLGGAVALGASGVLVGLPPPGPQLIILSLAFSAIAATTWLPSLRARVDALPVRAIVAIHAVRVVGVVFLVLAARGALSPVFAARAGWGDIVAAAGALALVASGGARTPRHRWAYLAWNTFGLIDLVVAVGTATVVLLSGDVPGMEPMTRLPMSLVPTLVVPLLVASHVVLYRRLWPREPRT